VNDLKKDAKTSYALGKYAKAEKYIEKGDRNRIAVIIGEGVISVGEKVQPRRKSVLRTIVNELRKSSSKDKKVKSY
jgi:hypothetical protein